MRAFSDALPLVVRPHSEREPPAIHTREPVVLGPDHWEDWMRMKPVNLAASVPLRLSRVDEGKIGQTMSLF